LTRRRKAKSSSILSERNLWIGVIVVAGWIALYLGWKAFWFLTDDAFIAFRHVSNSILGFGYVWNAPPFRPVEGYTSFLWVVVLDWVWRPGAPRLVVGSVRQWQTRSTTATRASLMRTRSGYATTTLTTH